MSAPLRILALCAGAFGCTDGGSDTGAADAAAGVEYRLQLLPILPANQQTLLGEAASVTLTLESADGGVETVTLSSIEGGFSAEEMDALAASTVTLQGMDAGGQVMAWGRTPPLDVVDGDERVVQFLVARPGAVAELPALPEPLTGGALTWDGQGRFLLFGGGTLGTSGNRSGLATVWALDTTSEDASDAFVAVGQMPGIDADITGRYGHTATLLTGDHPDRGRILVAGGAADFGGTDVVSDQVFLWDPTTDDAITLDISADTRRPTFLHDAVEDPDGNVVLLGGFPDSDDQRSYLFGAVGYFYDAAARETETLRLQAATAAYTLGAGARIEVEDGPRGVLVCGGADLTEDNFFQISDGCDLVETSGDVTPLEGGGDQLLVPVFHHAMTTLDDGRVLLTGGLISLESEPIPTSSTLNATNGAWIYDGDTWTATADTLRVPRALHEAVGLPDGRVLISGGVTANRGLFWTGDDAIACPEIFDPADGSFTLLDDDNGQCAEGPAAWQMAATDPLHGALVVGGLDEDDASVSQVVLHYADSPL